MTPPQVSKLSKDLRATSKGGLGRFQQALSFEQSYLFSFSTYETKWLLKLLETNALRWCRLWWSAKTNSGVAR